MAVAFVLFYKLNIITRAAVASTRVVTFVRGRRTTNASRRRVSVGLVRGNIDIRQLRRLQGGCRRLNNGDTVNTASLAPKRSHAQNGGGIGDHNGNARRNANANATAKVPPTGDVNHAPNRSHRRLPFSSAGPRLIRVRIRLGNFVPSSARLLQQSLRTFCTPGHGIFNESVFGGRCLSFRPGVGVTAPRSCVLNPKSLICVSVCNTSRHAVRTAIDPSNSIGVRNCNPIRIDNLAIDHTGRHLQSRLNRHCRGDGVHLAINRAESVLVGIVNRILVPNACALDTFTAIFRTLCVTNNIGSVNALESVGICHSGGLVASISVCSCVLGNGLDNGVQLTSGSIVIIKPCSYVMSIAKGIGHPVCCRVHGSRSLNALLGCTNNFANSTCAGAMHIIHGSNTTCSI